MAGSYGNKSLRQDIHSQLHAARNWRGVEWKDGYPTGHGIYSSLHLDGRAIKVVGIGSWGKAWIVWFTEEIVEGRDRGSE
ncbi:hypothetical protein AVEN_54818-1 [Araneus ventricosus]|uniref:Uncharacterized protein n=1 Tax=Araneus ventricosus TaxID=182803 RepID=A0A4Y2EYS8_ARAVE|nr:hypothetical protein AVEN_54818-1 [Araneus ventricosus]